MRLLPEGINPFTLEFSSPGTEKRFRIDYTNRSLPIVRIAMMVGALQYLLFFILDLMIEQLPESVGIVDLLIIRTVVFMVIVAITVLSFQDFFKRYFQFFVSLVPITAGIGVVIMIMLVQNSSGYDEYYVGVMIIFFYIHVLLRMRFIYATLVGWFLILMYFLALDFSTTPQGLLLNSTFFLISTQLCGMFASYSLEYYARLVFVQSRDLEERRKQVKVQYDFKANELNNLREIQRSLLPSTPPCFPGFEIAASLKTTTEVGGDFYDFFLNKSGSLTFSIGDATGHGAKAGVMVTAIKVLFVSMANTKSLTSFVSQASKIIAKTGLKKLYMSLAVGRLSVNKLDVVGAGMPPALLWRASEKVIEKISLNGMPLGSPAEYRYHLTSVELLPGDVLFFMSDGLPELFNEQREMYGYESPLHLLKQYAGLSAASILAAVEREILNFKGDEQLHDDISLIVIKKLMPASN
ncbi:PP2C family protein-serine/threonine phosphatase [Halalkalibaculum roseum]|nr:SpoIIE family protein phosphatase [Halalkalibaculum roseum]